jgi:hypothetical protein
VGTPVTVNQPEYYELSVTKRSQSDGMEESSRIQFIVRNSARADTEWGLPTWTPYPMMDSSSAEFTDGTLTLVCPAAYPTGLEIPVIARVNNPNGKRMGVNGKVTASGFETYPLTLFRGVGSVFLPAATESDDIFYTGTIQSLSTPKQITIESDTTWQTISGTLSASANWGENARIRITDTLTIASGATLTIEAGSVIIGAPDAEITVTGHISVNGTNGSPVVFTSQNRTAPWGGFLFESSTSQGDFSGTIFTASGADSNWVSNNTGMAVFKTPAMSVLSVHSAHVNLTTVYMVENKDSWAMAECYLTLQRCLVQKFVTGVSTSAAR